MRARKIPNLIQYVAALESKVLSTSEESERITNKYIEKYPTVLAEKVTLKDPLHDIELEIEIREGYKQPYLYKMPYAYHPECDKKVQELKTAGLLVDSSSKYAAPEVCGAMQMHREANFHID